MAKAYGLDIGSHSVKLVVLEGGARKHRVVRYANREIGEVGGVKETIAAVLKEGRAQRDNFVVALDSKSVVMREITIPFLQEDQIRRVLRYEAEAHLHNYAIEDVVVDAVKVGEVKDQSKVLIFAAPKDHLRERLEILSACEVDPMHVLLDMIALFNAAQSVGAFEKHPETIVLDIGATTTNMLFVREGELASCRTLRSGAESLTRVLSQDLAVDTDAARERAKEGDRSGRPGDLLTPIPLDDEVSEADRSAVELESAIVVQRQGDFLTRIYRETSRSLAAAPSRAAFTAIYVTGAASLTSGIQRRLEKRFGKPVIPLEFLDENCKAVPAADHEHANASMGVALGCALKLLGYDGIDVEFRREELRYTRKFDLIKVALASAVSLVFILLFLVWLDAQKTLKLRKQEFSGTRGGNSILTSVEKKYVKPTVQEYARILPEAAKRLPGVSPDVFRKLGSWQRQVSAMLGHITGKMGFDVQGIPTPRSALGVWRDVSEKVQEIRGMIGFFKLDSLRISQRTVQLNGLIGRRGHVDDIVREMKRLEDENGPYVDRVDPGETSEDPRTKKIRFGITLHLLERKVGDK